MAGKKITVVVSQAQGKNPAKRHFEEELVASLIMDPDVDVSLVPHLYDLTSDHTGMLFLRSVPGDLIVMAWLYPRAVRWILDRNGVRGHAGVTLLTSAEADSDDEPEETPEALPGDGIGSVDLPDRKIYCVDLQEQDDAKVVLDEVHRIAAERSVQTFDLMQWIQGSPKSAQLERYLHPAEQLAHASAPAHADDDGNGSAAGDKVKRRWYPVIDYDRCTNCMECIDFCLFGVYGVDKLDRILVEEQDSCKRGCPACSRVCPENAIIFPGHRTPAIAGADGEVAGLKIDLSKLFGAPSAIDTAAHERDMELIKDGRQTVGLSVGIPKRCSEKPPKARDELDDLIDSLDGFSL